MKIKQILNNNVVLLKKGSNEVIGFLAGVGFNKKVGDIVEEDDFEKIYVLDSTSLLEHFSFLLKKTEPKLIGLVNKIVQYGTENYKLKVGDYVYLTLLDHIENMVTRVKQDITFNSPLYWEVKRFYPEEYALGVYAVQLLENELNLQIPDSESIAIALHFINNQTSRLDFNITVQINKFIKDILTIVMYHFNVTLEEDDFHYSRFVTHLHYFAQNIFNKTLPNSDESDMYMQLKQLYPSVFECVQKIKLYISEEYDVIISEYEEIYLALHIQKLTENKGDK